MRDPERIHAIMWELEGLWQQYPDWRFMQLICNMQSKSGTDMFYTEDEQFVELVKILQEKGF